MLYGDETLKKINEKEENAYDNKGDCAALHRYPVRRCRVT